MYENSKEIFAKAIHQLLERHGGNQSEVGRQTKLSSGFISQVSRGQGPKDVKEETWRKVSKALGYDPRRPSVREDNADAVYLYDEELLALMQWIKTLPENERDRLLAFACGMGFEPEPEEK
ncbi:MAG: hypothetical protein AAF492_14755 [Verrucomicrobiota bacterium]